MVQLGVWARFQGARVRFARGGRHRGGLGELVSWAPRIGKDLHVLEDRSFPEGGVVSVEHEVALNLGALLALLRHVLPREVVVHGVPPFLPVFTLLAEAPWEQGGGRLVQKQEGIVGGVFRFAGAVIHQRVLRVLIHRIEAKEADEVRNENEQRRREGVLVPQRNTCGRWHMR